MPFLKRFVQLTIILFSLYVILTSCENSCGKLNDKMRYEAMVNDTSSSFSVYKNILIGKRAYFSYEEDVCLVANSYLYNSREAKFYESLGNMYEVYRVLGYGSEVNLYGTSDIKYRCPNVYASVKERLSKEPPYGTLEIDRILSKDTYGGSLIVELAKDKTTVEYKELHGWFLCEKAYGLISSVKCVFNAHVITREECNAIVQSIIKNLSEKYGPKYLWKNPAPFNYSDEYAWLVGKYEVHFCVRKGENYDSKHSSYEFIIEYVDNASLARQKKDYELKQKRGESNKNSEQERLKDEYRRSTL